MKKKLTVAAIIIGAAISAQELKVKKEQILLDSNPIAKVTRTKGTYIFQNLDNTPVYSMDIKYTYLDEDTRDNYILLKDVNDTKSNGIELNYDVSSAFANDEKIVVQNSFNKYGLLTSKGIDTDKLKQILTDTNYQRELSPKKMAVVEANNRVKSFNLFVNDKGEIFKGGESGSKVGYLKGMKTPFYLLDYHITEKNSILIYDNNNNKVAEFYPTTNKLEVANGNKYSFETSSPVKFRQVINRLIKLDSNFGN